jgi:hypothetical protein
MCGNCGFDSAQQPFGGVPAYGTAPYGAPGPFGAMAPLVKPASSKVPILLALGGVALLVVAGGLGLAVLGKGSSGGASASTSALALATPTHIPATLAATAEPTLADGTAEPSPLSAWTSYTAPDKTWTVQFPSSITPIKQSTPMNSGIATGDMTMYMTYDSSGVAYAIAYFDFAAGTIPNSANTYLKMMEATMTASTGGTLVASGDSTMAGNPSRDVTIEKSGLTYNLRMTFVGDRFYMMLVMAEPSADSYPQHFFDTLTLK